MAKYGAAFFGTFVYGPSAVIEFDAQPDTRALDYDKLRVSWITPVGTWTELRLVRSLSGYAATVDDGTLLVDQPSTAPVTSYTDTGLVPGRFYYYSLFVLVSGSWTRAGDVTGLTPKDYRYGSALFDFVPGIYRMKDAGLPEAALYGAGPLERFMNLFGFQLDTLRTEIDTLSWVQDPGRVAGGLLEPMAQSWGVEYEPELGMSLARTQIADAVYLFKMKGTKAGIEGITSALTGWGATVGMGVNLLLDQDDASFETSLGRWASVLNATVARRYRFTPPTLAQAVAPPAGPTVGNIGSGDWVLQVTSVAAGNMAAAIGPNYSGTTNNWTSASLYGVPVVAGTTYTFAGYSLAAATSRTNNVAVHWYDKTGTYLSSSIGAGTASSTSAWTRHAVTAAAPANAAWASLSVRTLATGAASEVQYWEAFQFEAAGAASAWQPARDIRITLTAERVNMMLNPNFEIDTTYWHAGTNTAIARSTAQFDTGSASMTLTAVAAGTTSAASALGLSAMPVTPRAWVSVRGRMRAATTGRGVRVDIGWLDAAGAQIGSTAGTATADVNTGFVNVGATGQAPVNAVFVFVVFYALGTGAAGEVHYLDSVIVEQALTNGAYFDGTTFSNEAEYLWGGAVSNSKSYFYSRRTTKNYRLNARLPEFLPAGATYTLLYAMN